MRRLSLVPFLLVALPVAASAQSFSENFDANHASSWNYVSSRGASDGANDDTGNEVDFSFDYSTVGIASAPHSVGGTTRGLKMEANVAGGVMSGASASPIGQSFTGDYTLTFDAWLNFNGPAPVGGNGSTQAMLAGIGGVSTAIQYPATNIDGIGFAATGDGNSSTDYRLYKSPGNTGVQEGDAAFAAGSRQAEAANGYYSSRFKGAIPAAQAALFPQQTGTVMPGAIGFAWRTWTIAKTGTTVTWSVDGSLIATATNVNPKGNNIFLGYFDINATSSSDPNDEKLLFGLVDNVKVTPVPEPASMLALSLGAAAMIRRRKKA